MLGEYHKIDKICSYKNIHNDYIYEIQDWLHDLSLISPQCLDVFVEEPYHLSEFSGEQKGDRLIDYPFPLLAVEDKMIPAKNVSDRLRYHYVDTRLYYDVDNDYPSPLNDLFFEHDTDGHNYCKDAKMLKMTSKHNQHKYEIISYISGYNRSKINRMFYELYTADIFAIRGKIYDPSKYKKYMDHYFNLVDKEISKMDKKYTREKFYKTLLSVYNDMSGGDLCDFHFVIPMDVYVLSRLLMVFDVTKMKKGPKGCQDDKYSKIENMIFYGGSYHARIYMKFFRDFFGQEPTIYIDHDHVDLPDESDQCLVFEKPFNFFANNK